MNETVKKMMIAAAVVGGCAAAVAASAAVWNSRRMKMLRAYRRTGKILYRVGAALQTVSEMME